MPSELAPGFLVASPTLLDPNFKQAVVLLTAHRPEGSLGFIINRGAPMDFEHVVTELGIAEESDDVPDVPVLTGGPVAPESGWVVFDPRSSDWDDEENVLKVTDALHISTSRELLDSIAHVENLERHILLLGYAGWGPGQLDVEIKQGAWIHVDLDESIVFDTPMPDRWEAALASLGIDPMMLVNMPRAEA